MVIALRASGVPFKYLLTGSLSRSRASPASSITPVAMNCLLDDYADEGRTPPLSPTARHSGRVWIGEELRGIHAGKSPSRVAVSVYRSRRCPNTICTARCRHALHPAEHHRHVLICSSSLRRRR